MLFRSSNPSYEEANLTSVGQSLKRSERRLPSLEDVPKRIAVGEPMTPVSKYYYKAPRNDALLNVSNHRVVAGLHGRCALNDLLGDIKLLALGVDLGHDGLQIRDRDVWTIPHEHLHNDRRIQE